MTWRCQCNHDRQGLLANHKPAKKTTDQRQNSAMNSGKLTWQRKKTKQPWIKDVSTSKKRIMIHCHVGLLEGKRGFWKKKQQQKRVCGCFFSEFMLKGEFDHHLEDIYHLKSPPLVPVPSPRWNQCPREWPSVWGCLLLQRPAQKMRGLRWVSAVDKTWQFLGSHRGPISPWSLLEYRFIDLNIFSII